MNEYIRGGARICRNCKVELEDGINIRPSAALKYDWQCNDCRKKHRNDNKKKEE